MEMQNLMSFLEGLFRVLFIIVGGRLSGGVSQSISCTTMTMNIPILQKTWILHTYVRLFDPPSFSLLTSPQDQIVAVIRLDIVGLERITNYLACFVAEGNLTASSSSSRNRQYISFASLLVFADPYLFLLSLSVWDSSSLLLLLVISLIQWVKDQPEEGIECGGYKRKKKKG